MISARRYLSYKLECSTGISTSEKNRKTLRENHDFSVVFKTANQLLTYYLIALFSAMNEWQCGLFLKCEVSPLLLASNMFI